MNYNANEHDRSGRCVRHPEVKLRRRKIYVPGTKYVFKWSKRLKYCPCCVMEFVLAVDPDVKGQVGLSRKGRLEILLPDKNDTDDEYDYSISAASSSSDTIPEECEESDHSVLAAGCSRGSQKASSCGKLKAALATPDNASSRRKNDDDDNNSYQQQKSSQQHDSSPTEVREFHKHLNYDLHHTDVTKPPLDDVFLCERSVGSIHGTVGSLDGSSDAGEPLGVDQVEATHAPADNELHQEQIWSRAVASWQNEKVEMKAAMSALKNENKQLQISLEQMTTCMSLSTKQESQNHTSTKESVSDSLYKEIVHRQDEIIQSLRDDIKCASTDQQKGIQEVVALLRQQVKELEAEKEINRAKYEHEIGILQQEIKSLQEAHAENMCMFVKMALEREKENSRALLSKFQIIEQDARSKVEQGSEIGERSKDVSDNSRKDEMSKEESLELKYKYFEQKAELEHLRAKLADERRRKEKKKKKKKSKESKGERTIRKDASVAVEQKNLPHFIEFDFGQQEPTDRNR